MPRFHTYCFNHKGAAELLPLEGQPLTRVWGRRFAGIQTDDILYIVTVADGVLHLFCRLHVGTVDLENGHIDARLSTPVTMVRPVELAVVRQLRFVNGKTEMPPRFVNENQLDRQTLRGVRRLTTASATLLDRLIDRDLAQPDPFLWRALSIRQPWVELILRGLKTIEVRSRTTSVRERVHIYASPIRLDPQREKQLSRRYAIDLDPLPRGVVAGSVRITGCRPLTRADSQSACFPIQNTQGSFAWELAGGRRAEHLLRPRRRPQPIWFYPFYEPDNR